MIDEDLPVQHVRGIVPRRKQVVKRLLFDHVDFEEKRKHAMKSASAADAFAVSLFGSAGEETASVEFDPFIDISKKSVRKMKVISPGLDFMLLAIY